MMGSRAEPVPHGGDLDAARLRHPAVPGPWLDLSTGINPRPYRVPQLEPGLWARLPQANAERELCRAAAARFGVADPAMIVPAPGTQALIQILPRLRGHRGRVAVLGPTYAEHARAWRREGHDVHEVATLEAALAADVIVAVNPDNPTGRLIARADLVSAAHELRRRDGLLIVDEAFIDVIEDAVGASLAGDLPTAAIVLRSAL